MRPPTLWRKQRYRQGPPADSLTPPAEADRPSDEPLWWEAVLAEVAAGTRTPGGPLARAARNARCSSAPPAEPPHWAHVLERVVARTLDPRDPNAVATRTAAIRDIGPVAVEEMLNEPVSEQTRAFRSLTLLEQAKRVLAYVDEATGSGPQNVRAELARDQRLRWRVFDRDGYRCRKCGATGAEADLTIDHIKPVSLGGTNAEPNLQTLCRSCNSRKGTTVLQDIGMAEADRAAHSTVAENEAHFAACRRELADPHSLPDVRRHAAGAVAGYEVWTATRAHDAALAASDAEVAAAAGRDIATAYAAWETVLVSIDAEEARQRLKASPKHA
jgi:hypothetical protein